MADVLAGCFAAVNASTFDRCHWGFRGLLRIRFGCDSSYISGLNRIRTDYPAVGAVRLFWSDRDWVLLAISLLILLAINLLQAWGTTL